MENTLNRNWPIYLVLAAMGFSFYTISKVFRTPTAPLVIADLSYEMPRPSQDDLPYDLSGRRVNRLQPPQAAQVVDAKPVAVTQPTAKVDVKTKASQEAAMNKAKLEKKKLDDKKRAALVAKNKRDKAKLSLNVVQAGFETSHRANQATDPVAEVAAVAPPYNAPVGETYADDPADQADKSKLTAQQWRNLLINEPSSKNGSNFLKAFHTGEIDAANFYQINEELLLDNKAERQRLALYILKQEDSALTFELLVAHDVEKNTEPMKGQIKAMIQSYTEAAKFPALTKALYSRDVKVVRRAGELLAQIVATQNAPSGSSAAISNRNSRSSASAGVTPAQLRASLPALTRLLKSNDTGIVQQAQALIESIQALKTNQPA